MTSPRDQQNPEPGQPERCRERRFVVLPLHPLYGREVIVVSRRRESNITVRCLVVLPENPEFRYRLPERWLESMPPSRSVPSARGTIRLPLAALDTLTQRLLGLQRAECAYAQPELADAYASAHLDSASAISTATFSGAVGASAAPDRSGSDK